MKQSNYMAFLQEARQFILQERICTDELRRLTWGTDADFYRLIPRIVIRSEGGEEISRLLKLANHHHLPVTFRAAGTNLSGQAISDSMLIVAGKHWKQYSLSAGHEETTLQPGIIGQRISELLAPFGRKFAPDPASVRSAMVGGIVMNNVSDMNCGIHANSDKILLSARVVLADETVLNTGDVVSHVAFEVTRHGFLCRTYTLRDEVRADERLSEHIHYKYSVRNVTGLNLFPLIRSGDPFDIIAHPIISSEGTLAFLSQVATKTEYGYPCKASTMLYFKTIKNACCAVVTMKRLTDNDGGWIVEEAELLDWKSPASVSDPVFLKYRGEICPSPLPGVESGGETGLTAVLTETKVRTDKKLKRNIGAIEHCLSHLRTYTLVCFTDKPGEYLRHWAIHPGIFPSVDRTRRPGATCLIKDVAFHIGGLSKATTELQQLIARHGYGDAYTYEHALEGSYHLIPNQSLGSDAKIKCCEEPMNDAKTLVVDKYDGSLETEHGTGRNMTPFVRYEWGDSAYEIMKTVKKLFDPQGLLSPGVIFNDDPKCHIKNFKPPPLIPPDTKSPAAEVDHCTECGFCEVNCPSCGFTLSSRQHIVLQREIARLRQNGDAPGRLALLEKQHLYPGNQTCAGDGLCSVSCPMRISTGDLTHTIRQEELSRGSLGYKAGNSTANHFADTKSALRPILGLADLNHSILGTKAMSGITKDIYNALGIPLWTPAMPKSYKFKLKKLKAGNRIAYFPSCINQTMGLPKKSPVEWPLVNKMIALFQKGGYEVIFPKDVEKLCCGTIWESKGMLDITNRRTAKLEAAPWEANKEGKYPVLCDQSPCLYRMCNTIQKTGLYEPTGFIYTFLRDKLSSAPTDRPIVVHITCPMYRMGLTDAIIALAQLYSTKVIVPEEIGCCSFTGDRGFTYPKLNTYALRKLRPQIEAAGIGVGYSSSRTCEIGLTVDSGIPYVSIAYLVDQCTQPLATTQD